MLALLPVQQLLVSLMLTGPIIIDIMIIILIMVHTIMEAIVGLSDFMIVGVDLFIIEHFVGENQLRP